MSERGRDRWLGFGVCVCVFVSLGLLIYDKNMCGSLGWFIVCVCAFVCLSVCDAHTYTQRRGREQERPCVPDK